MVLEQLLAGAKVACRSMAEEACGIIRTTATGIRMNALHK
jgi:hypothetical protein